MSMRSVVTTLSRNPALCVALFIPLLSIVVAGTLLMVSISAQRDTAKAAAATYTELPPLSKTSWREPLDRVSIKPQSQTQPQPPAGSPAQAAEAAP